MSQGLEEEFRRSDRENKSIKKKLYLLGIDLAPVLICLLAIIVIVILIETF